VVLKPLWRDPPVLALMISETVIWAAIFYSFPALVLLWQGEYGWSATTTLGAFSVALAVQGLAAPHMGRIIDRGGAPRAMTLGTVGALLGLAALTQVTVLWQFYTVWAWLGLMMAATLYDAAFSIVTRARGARARAAITAITLAAGFASTLAYPLTAIGLGCRAAGGPRSGCWRRLSLSSSCRSTVSPPRGWRPRRRPATPPACAAAGHGRDGRPGFWPLGLGFALTALGAAILLTNLLPLMAALGVPGTSPSSPLRSSGPRRSLGRMVLTLAGARAAARAVTLGAFFVISGAALALGAAHRDPRRGAGLRGGAGRGQRRHLDPAPGRHPRGHGRRRLRRKRGGRGAPVAFAFAAAPGLGAALADAAGYGAVLALCVLSPLAGALLLRRLPARMNEKGGPYWAAPVGDGRGSAIRRFRPRWPSCRLRDLDPARFQRLGHFAHEVDMQHAVFMGSPRHAHMVGQLEPLFEGAGGDAAMQVGARRLVLVLAGGDDKLGLALFHRQLGIGEAGHGDRDAVGVIAVFSIL
jgi:hypothetical protein